MVKQDGHQRALQPSATTRDTGRMLSRLFTFVAVIVLVCASTHTRANVQLPQSETAHRAFATIEETASSACALLSASDIKANGLPLEFCASAHRDYANNSPYKFTDPDGRDSAIFYTRQYRMAPPDPQTAAATLGLIADFTPVVGDIKGFVDAYNDPSAANIVAAGIGLVPGFGDAAGKLIKNADEIADLAKGAANGDRAGKAHTRAANRLGRELNRNANGGELVCPTCQKTMNDPVQSTPGGGVDRDAAVGDHVIAKSKGGDGATVKDMRNHETKCWECNSKKSDN